MEFSRLLKKHKMALGVYDGSQRRRFILRTPIAMNLVSVSEFDTARERKTAALRIIADREKTLASLEQKQITRQANKAQNYSASARTMSNPTGKH